MLWLLGFRGTSNCNETKLFDGRLTPYRMEEDLRPLLEAMKIRRFLHERHQFRVALCGHKVIEAGASCLVLMVQGRLSEISAAHLLIASKTGLLAVLPVLGITFTRYAKHLVNRWTASLFLGICTFAADATIHASHYPGKYTEAALTAVGAFLFSLLISFTPLGKHIDGLAEEFLSHQEPALKS